MSGMTRDRLLLLSTLLVIGCASETEVSGDSGNVSAPDAEVSLDGAAPIDGSTAADAGIDAGPAGSDATPSPDGFVADTSVTPDAGGADAGAPDAAATDGGAPPGPPTTYSVYDQEGSLIAEYAGDGSLVSEYLYLDGRLIAVIRGGATYAVQTDHLGAPRAVVSPSGQIVWRWRSEPYGSDPADQDPDGDGTPFVLDQRLPGQRYDAVTGLHGNQSRTYDPGTARYLEPDPLGVGESTNLYSYAAGDPLAASDPLGLFTVGMVEGLTQQQQSLKVDPAELALVQSLVNEVVSYLVSQGLRSPGTGRWNGYQNNFASNLQGAAYYKCADQAGDLLARLFGDRRFAGWGAQFADNGLFPPFKHVTALLTAPSGNQYIADPWVGTVTPYNPLGSQQPAGPRFTISK